jgi:Peptidase family M48
MLKVARVVVFVGLVVVMNTVGAAGDKEGDRETLPGQVGDPGEQSAGVVAQSAEQDVLPAEAIERVIANEAEVVKRVRTYAPLVETYVQELKADKERGYAPVGDKYFLGRAEFTKGVRFLALDDRGAQGKGYFLPMGKTFSFANEFLPDGLLQMIFVDAGGLDKQRYTFAYVRREELGEVRCLVFDVTPAEKGGKGRGSGHFSGRIWVEDQDYNIVRFSEDASGGRGGASFHYDSWRANVQPGVWLPAYVYSEEKGVRGTLLKREDLREQTRLWGYNIGRGGDDQELSKMLVETAVLDDTKTANDLSPQQAQRFWNRQAEDNVIDRMQRIGLIAPKGEVDKALDTVVDNLEVSNNLNFDPGVRCRVMMTTPLVAFTVGHTIVVSRGLVDMLGDEASLAAILAQQLGHIVLGHRLDSVYAFFDQINVEEKDAVRQFGFPRTAEEERAAGVKATELLEHSAYKERMGEAGRFLATLEAEQKEMPNLIGASLGKGLSGERKGEAEQRARGVEALAIGGRVRVDPWNDRLSMSKSDAAAAVGKEKAGFEVLAYTPYLTRY